MVDITPHTPPPPDLPESEALASPRITLPEGGQEVLEREVRVEGQAASAARVVVYADGAPLGTAQAGAGGEWAFVAPQPLAEGEHTIVARTTDGERVSLPSAPVRVVVLGDRLPDTGSRHASPAGRGFSWLVVALLVGAAVAESLRRR